MPPPVSVASKVAVQAESVEEMKAAHPLDAELFGAMGAATAHLCEDLSNSFIGKRFDFMDLGEFQALCPSGMGPIYWKEMLFRVYWAAALNMLRHQRWQAACISAFKTPANVLAFAAGLRGLLEASQDAHYSLRQIPRLLAENRQMIEAAINGHSRDRFGICKELEDRLIHFIYGRKVGKGETAIPESHYALEPKDYRNAIGLSEDKRDNFRQLYDHLCGICHPTAFSLAFLWEREGGWVQIKAGEDELYIRALCHKYEETISLAMSLSVTMSALSLKALNWFSLPQVNCSAIERWNFDAVPAWKKAQTAAFHFSPVAVS